MRSKVTVAIVGAGPYGLSLAAHLNAAGIENRIFGVPMQFWMQIAQAGEGRFLKSYCFGTNLSGPQPGATFADHNRPRGLETFEPCSMGNFVDYGRWFQKKQVPWVEETDVTSVAKVGSRFELGLKTGERVLADRVAIATGLSHFKYTPDMLRRLSSSVLTHTADIGDFRAFAGKEIAVVGAGQSALEAAALLHEYGAKSRLFIRESVISWHKRREPEVNLWRRIRSPITGLGTGPKAWLLTNFPGGLHRFPESFRTEFVKSHLPPEGAWWLRSRVEGVVPVDLSTSIVAAREAADGVYLTVRDNLHGAGREIHFDHVAAGTGYRVDVADLGFIEADTRAGIACHERSPRLDDAFQTSVPGLYMLGPLSAMSFGPLFRFVAGAEYTCRSITRHVAESVSTK